MKRLSVPATGVRAAPAPVGWRFRLHELIFEADTPGGKAFDLALHRGIFFRRLFQRLLDYLRGNECRRQANMLGGYDLSELGNLVWTGGD